MAGGLTEQKIQAALGNPKRSGRLEMIDAAEAGLRLRVSGAAAHWSVIARGLSGQRVRLPLGTWPSTGLEQARMTAGALKRAFAGGPAQEEDELSIANVLRRYKTRRLSQLRKGEVMGPAIECALKPLLHCRMDQVTRRQIGAVIDEMAERAPIHANRVLAYTKAFFNWAIGRGYIEQSPVGAITKPTRERARERTPSLAELAEIWVAAGQLGYPFGPIVRLLILTAARREEVGAMRTAELNLEDESGDACWIIPATRSKNGRAIRNPLSPSAKLVLAEALEARAVGEEFVFSTTGRTAVSGWSRAKGRLDALLLANRIAAAREPLPQWRLHDLRRAFATCACDTLHLDPVVVDRCLNHVGAGTTSTVSRVYARNELFDQRREALDRWGALLEEAVACREARASPAPTVAPSQDAV